MITIRNRRNTVKESSKPRIETASAGSMAAAPASQTRLLAFMATQPPSLIGIDACADAHLLAHELRLLGHLVKIIYPAFGMR